MWQERGKQSKCHCCSLLRSYSATAPGGGQQTTCEQQEKGKAERRLKIDVEENESHVLLPVSILYCVWQAQKKLCVLICLFYNSARRTRPLLFPHPRLSLFSHRPSQSCTALIKMILQTFLHLFCHSAISSFSLIFNLGFFSHPELPARFASPFSLSQQLSKEQKGQTLRLHHNQDSSWNFVPLGFDTFCMLNLILYFLLVSFSSLRLQDSLLNLSSEESPKKKRLCCGREEGETCWSVSKWCYINN